MNVFEAKVTSDGETLDLTGNTDKFVVESIEGLDPPSAQLNTSEIAGMDGSLYNSSRLNNRNIVINLMLRGDQAANRKELYKYFRVQRNVTISYKDKKHYVFADGYVESIECPPFKRTEMMQVSIVCTFPYLQDFYGETYWLSNSARGFEFPFAIDLDEPVAFSEYEAGRVTEIENETGVETGFTLNAMFDTDQATSFTLQNVDTGESMTISYSFKNGDLLAFDTRDATLVIALKRDGVWYNMFPYLASGFKILKLHSGTNRLAYMTNGHFYDEFVDVRLFYRATWQGV